MLVLGIDFETTWAEPVDPRVMRMIEMGWVLWDTEKNIPVIMGSELVNNAPNPWDQRITDLTGITPSLIEDMGVAEPDALERLDLAALNAEYLVGHNTNEFDKIVLEQSCLRHDPSGEKFRYLHLPWIDSKTDVPFPEKIEKKGRSLEMLCMSHKFLNPFAHRALTDVLSMFQVMSHYPWDDIIAASKIPMVTVIADPKWMQPPWKDSGKSNGLVKARGYRFDPETKYWFKKIKQHLVENEKKDAGFPVGVWNKK